MKRKNTTRNALFTSILSLLLCVSMLVGTTFAWFTDSVVSGNNVIAAGNLDIELLHTNAKVTDEDVQGNTALFVDEYGEAILWEPGVVTYETFTVKNVGNLALKYNMAINLTNENFVVDAEGKLTTYGLSSALKVALVNATPADRAAAIKAGTDAGWNSLKSFNLPNSLEAGKADTYTIVIYWQPSDQDNNWNVNNGKSVSDGYTTNDGEPALRIDLGINLFATQEMHEEDSFGKDYDKGAAWTGEVGEVPAEVDGVITITSAAELAAFAAAVNNGVDTFEGKTVKLGADINLNDTAWTPIGNNSNGWNNKFDGTFIGTGYTISNLYVTGTSGLGLFGYVGDNAHIEGVTIDGAYVSGTDYVGAVLGSGYLAENCLLNCTVKNANIIATPYLTVEGIYDGGAKAGAVAGYAMNGNINDNKAINCTVTAYRDLGGIVGMVSGENRTVTVSGNSVDNVTLTYLNLNGAAYDGNKVNENMGDIVGRISNVTVAEDNTATNVTRETVVTYTQDGIEYFKNVDAGTVTMWNITDAFTSDTLNVPEGVTALRNKLLNGNTAIKEVVIPASLTDFGGTANAAGTGASGGFFYGSAVEKITLPEGLTEIPAAAFNQAANLKEVNIPSSVTTIGINAFAGTGLTKLTVPATITSIGYGAFRDMKNLETVIIEGSANIPGYAFRSCTNLETVMLTNESVTFSNGQIFTNADTGDSSKITVYVPSEAIKTAYDTAETGYGHTIVVAAPAEDSTDLSTVIQNAIDGDIVLLTSGTYAIPAAAQGKELTIVGTEDTIISCNTAQNLSSAKLSLKGVTVQGINQNYKGFQHITSLTMVDCVIDSQTFLYGNTVVFENCVFNQSSSDAYNVWTYGSANVTFNNCVFNSAGKSVLIYNEGATGTAATFNSCIFNASAPVEGKAAIEIDSSLLKDSDMHVVKVNNSVANNFGQGSVSGDTLWNHKKGAKASVYVDGDDVVNTIKVGTLEELKAFANDVNVNGNGYSGKTVVLTADIDLNNEEWTPIGQTGGNGVKTYFQGTFDGKGYTISNLKVTDNTYDEGANYAAGLFGFIDAADAKIANLKVNNAYVSGHHWTGVIAGYLTGKITGCTVTNATVTCTHSNDDACGDKAGVIVGYVNSGIVTDNTVKDCTVTAGRDAGQVAGAAKTTQAYSNTIQNVTVAAGGDCTGANINNAEIGRVMD